MYKKYLNNNEEEYKDTLCIYLKQIGKIRRLSKEEELGLWQRLEACREERESLDEDDGRAFSLDKEIYSIQNKLVKSNLRLVISVAKRYYNSGIPFIDIIEEGNIGLIEAVKRFEYRKGFKFSTYGVWWIKQSIVKEIYSKKHMIRFPMHITRLIKESVKISRYLTQKLSREPTIEEIAKEVKIDRKILESIMMFTQEILTTSFPYKYSYNSYISSSIEDKNLHFPYQELFMDSLKDTLTEALKYLDEKEKTIIIYRFGLYGNEPKTLEYTGKELNITRERVRQIQIKALKKLANINLSIKLKSFLWDQ